jgi:hypothetical protein
MGVFPFDGSTELQASGKWLSFGNTNDATFLVYKLISCGHQFPFRSINYEMSVIGFFDAGVYGCT